VEAARWAGARAVRRLSIMRGILGREVPSFKIFTNFFEGLGDGEGQLIAGAGGRVEVTMGASQTGEGGGGQAEGAKVIDGFAVGLGLAQGEDALHGLADEVDLGLEVEG
jgi:hypothetical protein